MSPRQFGKVDVSATWPACLRCPCKHAGTVLCPRPGVWLVLELCPACNERTGLYCRTHRDRHMPALVAVAEPAGPTEDARSRAAGERGDEA